ncbi:MAG: hypothetical protein AAF363_18355 [Bacteroidota bacterium]
MKKYKVYTKVGNLPGGKADMKVYRTSNLVKFVRFLDESWPTWTWFNVWDQEKGIQIANYTRNNRPKKRYVT